MATPPPFYANTPDDTHCFQAALRMVMKHFQPEKEYGWHELDELSGKQEGFWTWPQQSLLKLRDMGYHVVDIDVFDYPRFIAEKGDYLADLYGKQEARVQIEHSDIDHEVGIATQFVAAGIHEKRVPSVEDIGSYLRNGFLVVCTINSRTINGREGFVGHFVVVYKIDTNTVTFHDPGLPGQRGRTVKVEEFVKAWAYGGPETPELMALKWQGRNHVPVREKLALPRPSLR